ncbi:MAG: hypothetical protein E5X74_02945 [Mesorhizobium sp.]|uniref:hypothetical protein n=1 Tax=Mesorhizobium sp. TaxID=1871066 RepID=UPI00122663F6|nr:hypothetical protein [Mesorhizobium sp.]TIO78377.1 MAG: hypothetical protein E5X75_04300 [Mesorhizobium sp.]TIO87975.1 MAG: hypothetical protein E5X74_02945 [Mesorhizobium sp.]
MTIVSRKVFLAAIAVSVLAGCKTTGYRDCDNIKPNVTHNAKCCGTGDAPCREGKGGNHDHRPDPRPQ